MSEQTTIIRQCPDCTGILTPQGILWSCTSPHPEALTTIEELATQLGITFTKHTQTFGLDTPNDATWELHGTYRTIPIGIASAYVDLVHYRDRIAQWQAQQHQ